jgi:hypothetical protein
VHDKEDAMTRSLPIVVALALLGCATAKTRPLAECTQKAAQQAAADYAQFAPLDVTKTFGPSQVVYFRAPAQPNNCI